MRGTNGSTPWWADQKRNHRVHVRMRRCEVLPAGRLTNAEYEEVRSHPARFFVASGHEDLTAGEVVVEKPRGSRSSRSVEGSARSSSAATRELRHSAMRDESLAKNEELFRKVNERIELVSHAVAQDDTMMEYLCECDRPDCYERVKATRSEYEAVRAESTHFIVLSRSRRPAGRARRSLERTILDRREAGSGGTGRRGKRPEKHPRQLRGSADRRPATPKRRR